MTNETGHGGPLVITESVKIRTTKTRDQIFSKNNRKLHLTGLKFQTSDRSEKNIVQSGLLISRKNFDDL